MKTIALLAATTLAATLASPPALAALCTGTGSITKVSNTSPAGLYEYVIFDVKKNPVLPYTVSSVTPPFTADPSGNPVTVNGNKFKQIQFNNVAWMCTIPHLLTLPKIQVKDVKRLGQFESIVTYIVGYQTASKYVTTYHYAVNSSRTKVVMKFKK